MLQKNFNRVTAVLLTIGMICVFIVFEKGKRTKLKYSYFLSKIEEKNNMQISELLRLFQDGLIIIDNNYNIQYKNETANKLIETNPDNFIDELKKMKFQDGRLIFESIHNVRFDLNQVSISLGVAERNEVLYE